MASLETVLTVAEVTLLLCLAAIGLHRGWLLILRTRSSRRSDPIPPTAEIADGETVDDLPRVTVQLPVFNERYVVTRLLDAVARLDYPRARLQVQILDDSTDDTSAIISRHLATLPPDLQVEHRRRSDRNGYKAGALTAGLESATGELIALFDADFVPPTDFLQRTVPRFTDPEVGVVQGRWEHLNAQRDLLTDTQAMLLDGHFRIEHPARAGTGCWFNFNGTAGVLRRRCIEDAGGWQYDTLTEDLDLSYRAQLAGWRFVYLEDLACPAELPTDMKAFLSQQYRWTKGALQTGCKLWPAVMRSPRLRWHQKLEATVHLLGSTVFPALLLLLATALPLQWLRYESVSSFDPTVAWLERFPPLAATACVLIYFGVARSRAGRLRLVGSLRLGMVFVAGAGLAVNNSAAIWSALRGRRSPFERTPKAADQDPSTLSVLYRSKRGWLPVVELTLAATVWSAAWLAVLNERPGTAGFYLAFGFGLAWTGGRSLLESVRRAPAADANTTATQTQGYR